MYEQLVRQKEMLAKLTGELYELKVFLKGNTPTKDETCEVISPNCLLDEIKINSTSIEGALLLINEINETIKGGK